jgi:hypothetical protein
MVEVDELRFTKLVDINLHCFTCFYQEMQSNPSHDDLAALILKSASWTFRQHCSLDAFCNRNSFG